jgi:hypothetical protein
MQESWMLISYGDFNITKKLFSYDRFGSHTLPIFTDAVAANEFMQHIIDLYKTKKDIRLNYCAEKKHLINTIELIIIAARDLKQVIIDPKFLEGNTPDTVRIGEQVKDILEFLEELSQ